MLTLQQAFLILSASHIGTPQENPSNLIHLETGQTTRADIMLSEIESHCTYRSNARWIGQSTFVRKSTLGFSHKASSFVERMSRRIEQTSFLQVLPRATFDVLD